MRRVIFSSRIAILLIVILSIAALTGCATLRGGLTYNNVNKDYETAQKLYTVAQQAVRDAYLADLIGDARYKKFIDEVDAEAIKVDKKIVTGLREAKNLKGVDQENKLNSILDMIASLSQITIKAGGFTK